VYQLTRRPRALADIWLRWWAAHGCALSPNTQHGYRRTQALTAELGDHPEPGDVVAWIASMRARGYRPTTVASHRDQLRAVYTFALQAGWARFNPVSLAPWRRPSAPTPVVLRDIEALFPSILACATTSREAALLGVLRYTGVRIDEAIALELADIARDDGGGWRLSVVRQRSDPQRLATSSPKGRGALGHRAIPVRDPLRHLLEPLFGLGPSLVKFVQPVRYVRTELLFPYRRWDLSVLMARIRRRVPGRFPKGRAWHVFRHTFAWEFIKAGGQLDDLRTLLGHVKYETTEHYAGRLFGTAVSANVFDRLPQLDRSWRRNG
jgi:site-specific recombinase XerD